MQEVSLFFKNQRFFEKKREFLSEQVNMTIK